MCTIMGLCVHANSLYLFIDGYNERILFSKPMHYNKVRILLVSGVLEYANFLTIFTDNCIHRLGHESAREHNAGERSSLLAEWLRILGGAIVLVI